MRDTKASVVAWLPASSRHERLIARALGDAAPVAFCRTLKSLLAELAHGIARVVIVAIGAGSVPSASAVVAAVKERHPTMRVVGSCWLGSASSAEVVDCSRAGLDAVALRGHDDLGQLVLRALANGAGDEAAVLHDLSRVLTSATRRWASVILARAGDGSNVAMLARAVGCTPRTLQRVAREEGQCGPAELIECVRVLHAAHLLAVHRLSVEQVVLATGYPSATGLRRAMRRTEVAPPRDLRGALAYAAARDAIVRRLARRESRSAIDDLDRFTFSRTRNVGREVIGPRAPNDLPINWETQAAQAT